MAAFSQLLFAIATIINVDLSNNFNLAFYTYLTVTLPAILISIYGKHSPKKLYEEFKLYNKPLLLTSACAWCMMLNSSIRAYQLGSIIIVTSLFALTPILNSLAELIFNKNKENNNFNSFNNWCNPSKLIIYIKRQQVSTCCISLLNML